MNLSSISYRFDGSAWIHALVHSNAPGSYQTRFWTSPTVSRITEVSPDADARPPQKPTPPGSRKHEVNPQATPSSIVRSNGSSESAALPCTPPPIPRADAAIHPG